MDHELIKDVNGNLVAIPKQDLENFRIRQQKEIDEEISIGFIFGIPFREVLEIKRIWIELAGSNTSSNFKAADFVKAIRKT